MTKEQILAKFSVIDLAKLEKLYKYSNLLIIPEEDLLVNATMSQMYEKAMTLSDIYFPEWTDRSESDFGRFLVELFCLFSEKDFWYINAFANEALTSKMSVYSDAFTRGISLGYDPVITRGARASFNVTFKEGTDYTYKRGELILILSDLDLQFTNDFEFTVAASLSPTTVPLVLTEGVQVVDNVSFNGHNVIVSRSLCDVESISLLSNNIIFDRVRTFGKSSNVSNHFIVLPEINGELTVFFGTDGFGKTPDIGQPMKLYYRTCKGDKGNCLLQDNISISKSSLLRVALGATMLSNATKGTLPESLTSLKNNIPLFLSNKKAAINVTVTEGILNTFPEVKKAKVTVVGNNVFFRIIPLDGSVPTAALLQSCQDRITPLMMLGYNCLSQINDYVTVSPINVTVFVLAAYNNPNTVSLLSQLIEDYTNPLVLADYGQSFNLSDLSLLLKSKIPGVQNVVFNIVAGVAAASIVVAGSQIMQKIIQSDLTITINAV